MSIKQTKPPVWWACIFGLAVGLTAMALLGRPEGIPAAAMWWLVGAFGALYSAGLRLKRKPARTATAEHPEPLEQGYEVVPEYSETTAKHRMGPPWSAEVLRPRRPSDDIERSLLFPSLRYNPPYHPRGVAAGKGWTADEACRNAILSFQRAEKLKQRIDGEKEIAQMVWAPDSLSSEEDA